MLILFTVVVEIRTYKADELIKLVLDEIEDAISIF